MLQLKSPIFSFSHFNLKYLTLKKVRLLPIPGKGFIRKRKVRYTKNKVNSLLLLRQIKKRNLKQKIFLAFVSVFVYLN